MEASIGRHIAQTIEADHNPNKHARENDCIRMNVTRKHSNRNSIVSNNLTSNTEHSACSFPLDIKYRS
jgi:hypothetical protein